jgi:hypothetical protein
MTYRLGQSFECASLGADLTISSTCDGNGSGPRHQLFSNNNCRDIVAALGGGCSPPPQVCASESFLEVGESVRETTVASTGPRERLRLWMRIASPLELDPCLLDILERLANGRWSIGAVRGQDLPESANRAELPIGY